MLIRIQGDHREAVYNTANLSRFAVRAFFGSSRKMKEEYPEKRNLRCRVNVWMKKCYALLD